MMKVLHAGCGGGELPPWMHAAAGEIAETRLDINPDVKPDVVASLTELGPIGPFDTVYCCHCLEHLFPHDVKKALKEFLRVLRPGGSVVIRVPDLEDVRPTEEVVYTAESGLPITGLDMFYGWRPAVELTPFMAHHTGFIRDTLLKAFREAGFSESKVGRLLGMYELMGVAVK